ncbi:hypothetical protein FJTKL_14338 [Diaporthe vaccinii]|uniref:Aminoglycoside phosphotransferase domain-containing protein n=1 Tax=Diaporthe vaccinii TaxID=105482 RepID=A0ABR4E8A0_9PEZI
MLAVGTSEQLIGWSRFWRLGCRRTDYLFDAGTTRPSLLDKFPHLSSIPNAQNDNAQNGNAQNDKAQDNNAQDNNARNKMDPTQNAGEQASSKRQLVSSWREDEILSVFKQTPKCKANGNSVTGFVFPVKHPIVYVKFCFPPARGMAEVKNHDYAFRALKAMPPNQTQGIFIPEIYRTFQNDDRVFIVMDYIDGKTLRQLQEQQDWDSKKETFINDIARAIQLLMSIQPPPGQKPGPVGGGHIRHPLFKDDSAFGEYSSVEELEKHLNKVSTIRDKAAPTVSLEKDLCFYYSDLFPGNFMFTAAGNLYVIDFDQAGFLPLSFMSFALAESRWSPGLWIKDILRLPEHNLDAMKNIFYWFAIGVSWLGHPRPERRRY